MSDLAPFRRAGGISEADVAAAAAALPAATAILTLRGGRALDEDEAAREQHAPPRPRRRLPWGGLGYYRRLMADFEGELPDMKLLFNFGDRPRSWTTPLPPAEEAALRAGTLGVQVAWERHACDAAVGPGMRRKHGLFQKGPFWGRRGPLPVLSGWRVEGCFSGEAAQGPGLPLKGRDFAAQRCRQLGRYQPHTDDEVLSSYRRYMGSFISCSS